MPSANRILSTAKMMMKKGHHITAVTRNGEKCAKFTFIFRKKFYLSRKYAVPKFATSCSRETLTAILPQNPAKIKLKIEKIS